MKPSLDIDVYFDLICPWCLIGKRDLTKALQQLQAIQPDLKPRVIWHSFPLLPDIPLAGLPYQEFYERRLGGPAAVAARRAQVREAGQLADVTFAFDNISVMPNTQAAHALISLTRQTADDAPTNSLIDALFAAYFIQGRDIGDVSVLIEIASECGLTITLQEMASAMATGKPADKASEVSGVPYYVFNNRLAMTGAHPPETLLKAMQRSIE